MSQFNLIGYSNSGANVLNLTCSENGAMLIPFGVSNERPVAPVGGMLRYNTTDTIFEYYNGTSWLPVSSQPPSITSITPLSVADNSNGVYDISINIIGENFGATPNVYFIGSDSIERQSPAVTDIFSGTQVRATIPTSVYDNSNQEPFAVKLLNTSSGVSVTSISPNVIDINSVPYFITTSPLPDISNGISGSVTLSGQFDISAGDTDDLTLTWSSPTPSPISDIQSAALILNSSTGAITGTLTNPGSTTTYNFNVKIEDTAGNFRIKLYSFTFSVPVAYTATTTGSNVTTIYVDSGNSVQLSPTVGGYTIIVFGLTTGTGNTTTQSNTITPNFSSSDIKYLVLGGGGGTPGSNSTPSGGGGAGGYRTNYSGSSPNISFVASTSYSISVGGGGAAGTSGSNNASSGSASSLAYNGGTITSSGGGKGAFDNQSGSVGGSGGGGSLGGGGGAGNSGGYTPVEGFSGGSSNWSGGAQIAGGGGGASTSGASGSPSGASGGAGGSGLSSTITGTSVIRGGGGAGASWGSNVRQGGSGGGGNQNTNGSNGLGGGAGGAGNTAQNNLAGKAGGNGIVIVRFPSFL